mgnify:CR=1 FL=1
MKTIVLGDTHGRSVWKLITHKENPDRLKSLTKIDLYLSKFQHKLTNITGDNLTLFKERIKVYSDIELEALLETIRSQISNSGLQSGIHQFFYTGTTVVEKLGCNYGLKLQGYANNLSKNNSVKEALDEMSIEMLSFTNISPQKRLMFILLMAGVSTHSLNSTDESLKTILDQDLKEDVVNKYAEL